MKRQQVTSSMIRSVGYDEAQQTLEVEFNSGAVYQYHQVPKEVYREMLNAPSHGRYFLGTIKDAYPYTRVK